MEFLAAFVKHVLRCTWLLQTAKSHDNKSHASDATKYFCFAPNSHAIYSLYNIDGVESSLLFIDIGGRRKFIDRKKTVLIGLRN